jgi:(1->4)-alpha-D-glucan 1-alpha-D-glucosylmutase
MIPRATYRIQFHKGFTFADAAALAPQLAALGISHLYASPIGTARTGSTHGYDVVDPAHINPELGGEQAFRAMAATLREHGLGIVLDIVPNHMAVGGDDNAWWLDVLENGQASEHAATFDIDWDALDGKLLAPFLGQPYGEALADRALTLTNDGDAVIAHGTHRFPLRPEDKGADPAAHDPSTNEGRARLHALLERQHYRLAWWRTAADEINWRRFFDITELAGLRIEDGRVFDAVHALPLRLYAEGLIDGVRVDHVDGLADPAGYCRRLRMALDERRPGGWLIVEKILAADEALPTDWQTDGTSGYDFMNEVSALLHDPAGEAPLTALWAERTGRPADFEAEEHRARREILDWTLPGQRDAAARALHGVLSSEAATRDMTLGMVHRALTGLLLQFTAYRTYAGTADDGADRLMRAADAARADAAPGEGDLPARLAALILKGGDHARRFEQLSAPLAAKAVEDTAFYRYGRLLSRTDVGFDPARFAQTPAAFLDHVAARARDFPNAMLTTATHDHKRGEDVRARLAAISTLPDAYAALVETLDAQFDGVDPVDRDPVVQTIVGAWPLVGAPDEDFVERVTGWSRKALREAKLRSSWTAPDEGYEAVVAAAIERLMTGDVRATLAAFADRIAPAGAVNGLTQALLRTTLPGVPDCYQGAERWDLSLVDPDNRRPVDYAAHRPMPHWADAPALLPDWRSGAVKQALIGEALRLRVEHPAIFAAPLEPVEVTGERAASTIAFRRVADGQALTAAAPLHCTAIDPQTLAIRPDWFGDTAIVIEGEERRAADLFTTMPVLLTIEPS